MGDSLSDKFASEKSTIVEWGGEIVHSIYEFESIPENLKVEFVSAKVAPVQGIRLKARGCLLALNGIESNDLVLWHDIAPKELTINIRHTKNRNASLKIWNVWRGGLGVTQAWLGNAGMMVMADSDNGNFQLHCSDGQGQVNFEDLKIDLSAR